MLQCISDQLNSIPSHNLVMNFCLQRHTSTLTCHNSSQTTTTNINVSFLKCESTAQFPGLQAHVSAEAGLLASALPCEHVYSK